MLTGLLRLMKIPLFGGLAVTLPFDIPAPSVGAIAGLSAVAFGGLCVLVVAVIVVAFLVIRAIRKKQAHKDQS
jgi:hypothetical protein